MNNTNKLQHYTVDVMHQKNSNGNWMHHVLLELNMEDGSPNTEKKSTVIIEPFTSAAAYQLPY